MRESGSGLVAVALAAVLVAAPAAAAPAPDSAGAAQWRLGAAVSIGSQGVAPLGNRSYLHETRTLKLVAARPLLVRRRFSLQLSLEPFAGESRHRLVNPWFVRPGPRADAQRARFTSGETILEAGVDVGLAARWALTPRLGVYVLGSVGPMWGDTGTERLARGFAFSDIVAGGIAWRADRIELELRPGFRHVSNAYLAQPNSGHNAMFVLVAVTVAR